jgi:hypothetical protein
MEPLAQNTEAQKKIARVNEGEKSFPIPSWRLFKKILNCMQLLEMQLSVTCLHSWVDGIVEHG